MTRKRNAAAPDEGTTARGRGVPASRVHKTATPSNVIEGPWGDPLRAQVPEGFYVVAFLAERERRRYGRMVFDLEFQIIDGPKGASDTLRFQGQRLVRFLSRPQKAPGGRNSLRSNLAKDYRQITGLVPPRGLHSFHPQDLYANCQLEVRVGYIERNEDGLVVPEGARYSVIRQIVARVAGVPPILQRKGRS